MTVSVLGDFFHRNNLVWFSIPVWCVIFSLFRIFQFELTSVTQFAAHQENKRLVGFVVRTPESTGGESLSTYVFESNSEGEKVLLFFFILRFRSQSKERSEGVFCNHHPSEYLVNYFASSL